MKVANTGSRGHCSRCRQTTRVAVGAQLSTEYARILPCLWLWTLPSARDFDRCVACGTPFEGAKEIRALYRIENVSTRRAERITANEEERVRGATKCRPPCSSPKRMELQCIKTLFEDEQGELLELQYGAAATVWRMNFLVEKAQRQKHPRLQYQSGDRSLGGGADETGEVQWICHRMSSAAAHRSLRGRSPQCVGYPVSRGARHHHHGDIAIRHQARH